MITTILLTTIWFLLLIAYLLLSSGWSSTRVVYGPVVEDSPEVRNQLRNCFIHPGADILGTPAGLIAKHRGPKRWSVYYYCRYRQGYTEYKCRIKKGSALHQEIEMTMKHLREQQLLFGATT